MPAVVVDTHAIVWYLLGDGRLSRTAEQCLDDCTQGGDAIVVPSVSLVEITYLEEKGRISPGTRAILLGALDGPDAPYRFQPLDRWVADALPLVPRAEVPDFPDRIIAATAVALGLPLVSRDARIRSSRVRAIW